MFDDWVAIVPRGDGATPVQSCCGAENGHGRSRWTAARPSQRTGRVRPGPQREEIDLNWIAVEMDGQREKALRTMQDRIEELIRLADAHEEHVLAALLCDAHDHTVQRLNSVG